jgi:glucosamine kinase
MALFLGIDGGGSKTDCIVGDETSVLGWGGSSSCKIARVGEEAAGAALREGIQRACAAAGVEIALLSHACIGVAGASQGESMAAIRRLLSGIISCEIEILGDMEIAHQAAFEGGPGIIVISGTGSIAYGRNENGETARAGGLGAATGDPGSGQWVGRTAVELLFIASEYGRRPALLHDVLKTWNLGGVPELAQALAASPPRDFAALFPLLSASGDPIARRTLVRAGSELAAIAADVIGRLWPQPAPVEVAMYGGVLENSADVRDAFAAELCKRYPEARPAMGKRRPAEGALLVARKAAAKASSGIASA